MNQRCSTTGLCTIRVVYSEIQKISKSQQKSVHFANPKAVTKGRISSGKILKTTVKTIQMGNSTPLFTGIYRTFLAIEKWPICQKIWTPPEPTIQWTLRHTSTNVNMNAKEKMETCVCDTCGTCKRVGVHCLQYTGTTVHYEMKWPIRPGIVVHRTLRTN